MQNGLCSILSYPERGSGGDNRYRGNCSPKLIADLLGFFKPAQVCDYMCGSRTTAYAAASLGIGSRCYDLHSGFDLLSCDISERPEFIFWHPPYWDIVTYSGNMYSTEGVEAKPGFDPRPRDLSRMADWGSFVAAMNYAVTKQFCALEKGGRMAVLVGDIKKRGRLYSMLLELTKPGTLEYVLIKAQHNCTSSGRSYTGRFIPIVHEYVLVVRKDAALLVPLMLTRKSEKDVLDMPGATWCDVVAAVLEEANGSVSLSYIYEQIAPYTKAQKNPHWREKVRQTLQIHPDHFVRVAKGTWALRLGQ